MKVIGTSENHVILEATKREVAELCGYYSEYSKVIYELKHGTIINVHGMYSQLYSLAQQEAKRKRAMSKLLPTRPDTFNDHKFFRVFSLENGRRFFIGRTETSPGALAIAIKQMLVSHPNDKVLVLKPHTGQLAYRLSIQHNERNNPIIVNELTKETVHEMELVNRPSFKL